MTFATLKNYVTRITGPLAYEYVALLREAENDFIERTFCIWKHDLVNTSSLNGGTLSDTYALPTGFVQFLKFEWEGTPIPPANILHNVWIYNSDGSLRTGTPEAYQIEPDNFRLIPKPSSHGYMGRWYVYYQTSTADSPIIPTIEHKKIPNYVIWQILEMESEKKPELLQKAIYYKEAYLDECSSTYQKYKNMIRKQLRIYDYRSSGLTLQQRCPTVTES